METRRTKAPTKSSLTITVGDFFISTLRTHSLLTMNKTKKRAQKRAKARRPFIIGFERLSYFEQIKYVRVERRCTLREARDIVSALNEPTPRGSRRPQPSWNSAPLVPDSDDILF
jgi:hypothetical protein